MLNVWRSIGNWPLLHGTSLVGDQVTCLTRHTPAVQSPKFRLPSAKARHPHLANVRSTTRERGNDFQGWTICTDGALALLDGVLLHDLAMEELLHGDVTLQSMITPAVLDAQMNLTLSLITRNVPDCTTSFLLETCYDMTTNKLVVTRLDLPGVPAEPSVWSCGSRLP